MIVDKNIIISICIVVYGSSLTGMEIIKQMGQEQEVEIEEEEEEEEIDREEERKASSERGLRKQAQAGNIEYVRMALHFEKFDFLSLARAYVGALGRAKKLTPNNTVRYDADMQESLKKVYNQREIALKKINDHKKNKNIKYSIDEILIDQGNMALLCSEEIFPYVEPLIMQENHVNVLYFLIGQTGDVTLLQYFVMQYESFIDLNSYNGTGETLLHIASKEGNLKLVEYLLSKGVNCNKQSLAIQEADFCSTPLHYAVEKRLCDVVDCLLNAKADPNIRDFKNKTALYYVAPGSSGHQRIFEALVKAGADIDDTGYNGKTFLYKAVQENNLDEVAYLMKWGANPFIKCTIKPGGYSLAYVQTDSGIVTQQVYHPAILETPIKHALWVNYTDPGDQWNNGKIIGLFQQYRKKKFAQQK